MNKFKLLSYSIIVILYVILTLQVIFSFTQSFEATKDFLFVLKETGLSIVMGFINVLIMFGISNKIKINLGSEKDHRTIKLCTYIITVLMIIIWSMFLLLSIAFTYSMPINLEFAQLATTAALIAGITALIVIVSLFSISIRTGPKT